MSRMIRISDGCYVAGLRHTDPFDSARVGDYNNGWNDRHMAAIAQLSEERILELAEPFGEFRYGDAQGDKRVGFARAVAASLSAVPSAPAAQGWIPVSERLPEGTVLASYTNNYNKSRIIRAEYVQKFTQESEDMDNFDAQYDEDTDTYYDCEGWYEMIDNWGDYSSVAVTEGTVTHWMPLPSAPKGGE